jgi:prevent-host-death family protein
VFFLLTNIVDHGLIVLVKKVAISEFKAKCISLIDEVQKTKRPICITRFGKPIAEVSPPSAKTKGADWFGSMKDEIQVLGDIISPANDKDEWEALRD